MRWDAGSIYKKIRKSKGLSQNEVCGTSISRTTLSKFENNKLSPSYDTMVYLLLQIDMSEEEFQFVCNDFSYDLRDEIITLFFRQTSNLETAQLFRLLEKGNKYLKTADDIFIRNLMKIIQSLTLLTNDQIEQIDCLPKIIISDVWSKLSKMDEWYYSELRLINSFMYYFPIETVLSFLPKLLETVEKYEKFTPMITIRLSILLNVGLLLIQNNHKEVAIPLLKEAIDLGKEAKRYDYLSIAKVRYAICIDDYKIACEGFLLLEMTEENDILEHVKKEWAVFSS
ncbi:Rgg/GadR/MutR family transcriptional regulator [Enterococcus casseliflavus]|uniref:Rgg/GadR/MutR family transcriptional regulator n=1 Tax=Enterococcus casseliflavus TaxID=37734 RepID=UPI0013302D38|nr:Rgg/GadR/MutR family transcriptional regulator [Enterococcus casseliflavus]WEL47617.1 helix-turn-helix domain-containing protein [Enterococcus casseliflavus]